MEQAVGAIVSMRQDEGGVNIWRECGHVEGCGHKGDVNVEGVTT